MNDDILGYLFDALDVEDERRIEQRIDEDPAFRKRVEELRRLTMPLAEDDCIQPPPGLASRTFACIQDSYTPKPVLTCAREWASEPRTAMRPLDFAVAACLLGVAAILVFPAIASLRGDHARILCTEQLRNLGISLAMYADQEHGLFPSVEAEGPMSFAGVFAMRLKNKELLTDDRMLVCPSANSAIVKVPTLEEYKSAFERPDRAAKELKYLSGSYGYALGFRENGRHQQLVDLNDSQPMLSDRPPRQDERWYNNSPNHQNLGQNVLCAGGSVRWFPSRVYGQDDLFRNNACEIAAGVGPRDAVIGVSEAAAYPSAGL